MWIIYAIWLIVIVYLTVAALGVKWDTQGHLGQSFGLMFAIIASFLLSHLPIFHFLNFAPVNPVLSSIGVILCAAGLIACIGSAIVTGGAWIFLLLILGTLFLWRVGAEDTLMEQQFPNEYPDYEKRTKALIPFVW